MFTLISICNPVLVEVVNKYLSSVKQPNTELQQLMLLLFNSSAKDKQKTVSSVVGGNYVIHIRSKLKSVVLVHEEFVCTRYHMSYIYYFQERLQGNQMYTTFNEDGQDEDNNDSKKKDKKKSEKGTFFKLFSTFT